MPKKRCAFCNNAAVTTSNNTLLCANHYFKERAMVDVPFGPKSRQQNHWSVLLRDLRSEARLTQKELSLKTKMSQRTIADYENIHEPRQLSIYKVERLLEALGYDLDAVLAKKDV